ncbi:MAG TPA: hypothetical protein VG388_06340 [Solirubrobacteraceae bacterium]|jgi:hypothetical protein|nr:hypothetical protein [Solirubrobacteraceae bacterium]
MEGQDPFDALCQSLKRAIAALRDAQVPYALAGSLASWARGGPQPQNDIDLMVPPSDAEAALGALAGAGMRREQPPEEWLFKAWDGEVMIDLIFQPAGHDSSDAVIGRAETLTVLGMATSVITLEDLLSTKLNAMDEHSLDYRAVLGIARSLREQINWSRLRSLTSDSPYAKAFFTLVEELGVAPRAAGALPAPTNVRVVSPSG